MHRNEIKHWTASTSDTPTWRDGLHGSDRTYVIVAVPKVSTDGYKAIVYGRGIGHGKVKFYPDPLALGLEQRQLNAQGFSNWITRTNAGYVRATCTLVNLNTLLKSLDPEHWVVCPLDQLESVLSAQDGRQSSRARHPVDHDFQILETVVDGGGLAGLFKTKPPEGVQPQVE